VVPVGHLGLPAQQALAYVTAIIGADYVVALHILDDEAGEDAYRAEYDELG